MPTFLIMWRRRPVAALVIVLMLALAGCGSSAVQQVPSATATATPTFASVFPPHHPVRMRPDVAYGPAPLETLDLCQPTDSTGPLPGLVLIHGGSSTVGDKRAEFDVQGDTLADACLGLASQGFVVASINYRLAHADPWPAQINDAQLAVRWLRSHAGEIGLNPQHVCSVGLSSGGYLAVFLGALSKTLPGDRASLLADQSSQTTCVADFYGEVDLATWVTTSDDNRAEILDLLHGATPQSNPALYRAASPLYAVTSASAPMLIVQGSQDTEVPESQSRALEQALQKANVPVQYIEYTGGHVFEGLTPDQVRTIWGQAITYLAAH